MARFISALPHRELQNTAPNRGPNQWKKANVDDGFAPLDVTRFHRDPLDSGAGWQRPNWFGAADCTLIEAVLHPPSTSPSRTPFALVPRPGIARTTPASSHDLFVIAFACRRNIRRRSQPAQQPSEIEFLEVAEPPHHHLRAAGRNRQYRSRICCDALPADNPCRR